MDLAKIFTGSLTESVQITLIIFVLMVIVEFLVLKFKGRFLNFLKKNRLVKYVTASFFGIIPGCIGSFAMDSMYMTGLLGFGGITATMIATSGDEAFLMLGMAAKGEISWSIVLGMTALLFVLGIAGAFMADTVSRKTKMKFCEKCAITYHPKNEFQTGHFLKEHIVNHIVKKHIWKIFIWIFAAIFVIQMLEGQIDLHLTGISMFYVLFIASLIGVLPISGPNVFLIVMFSHGMIPFSVLLANSIIQDGHGLLPIIGFSLDDALKIKVFNFAFGLSIGAVLLMAGI
ncbi:MAG: arsenic efflux protein [Candidatus Aenigmarchaeota archaeon]|nr:arsenic efflux protein [Candidatus Aenigmarchaeota archaeon]